jgi:hypothetical protein
MTIIWTFFNCEYFTGDMDNGLLVWIILPIGYISVHTFEYINQYLRPLKVVSFIEIYFLTARELNKLKDL